MICRYSALAHRFVKYGYLAPMNVLWTYYFINGMREEAMGVWERYVKDCPQIMFQKVCQTARSRNSLQVSTCMSRSVLHQKVLIEHDELEHKNFVCATDGV